MIRREDSMRKSRFADEQKIAILQQVAAGAQARELCRTHGITERTFHCCLYKSPG
jgi:transposase-like protein